MATQSASSQAEEHPRSDLVIRASREEDIAAITAIYGYHVLHGVASFEEIPPAPDEIAQRRLNIVARGLPYLVAERHGRVLGYCYASAYRTRSAYRFTLEDSIYIDAAEVGRGIGRALLSAVIEQCSELGYRQMVAVIGGSDQWPSIRLHERLGFTRTGLLPAVGFKFGRWIDTVLMQRALGPGATSLPSGLGTSIKGGEHG
jgi:L-amino acid N-acyltransferase YncA